METKLGFTKMSIAEFEQWLDNLWQKFKKALWPILLINSLKSIMVQYEQIPYFFFYKPLNPIN